MIKNLVRYLLPMSLRRILRAPYLVPKSYKRFIDESEAIVHERIAGNPNMLRIRGEVRKYAHILDKGMQRPDVEAGHSSETSEAYKTYRSFILDAHGKPDLLWSDFVYKAFTDLQIEGRLPVEYAANLIDTEVKANVSEADFEKLIKSRRTHRHFIKVPVSQCTIEKIAHASSFAPSSCNRQALKFYVSLNPEIIEKCCRLNAGFTGFSGPPLAFFSICVDLSAYDLPKELYTPTLDAGLGLQNSILMAHASGLTMAVLNWSQSTEVEEVELRLLLGIPKNYRITANAILGMPRVRAPEPTRKAVHEAVEVIR